MHARQVLYRLSHNSTLPTVLLNDLSHVLPDTQNRAKEAHGASQSLVKGTLETPEALEPREALEALEALETLGATIVPMALDALVWSLQSPGNQQGRCVTPQLQRCQGSHSELCSRLKDPVCGAWLVW